MINLGKAQNLLLYKEIHLLWPYSFSLCCAVLSIISRYRYVTNDYT